MRLTGQLEIMNFRNKVSPTRAALSAPDCAYAEKLIPQMDDM
jgi:hypothetical protein